MTYKAVFNKTQDAWFVVQADNDSLLGLRPYSVENKAKFVAFHRNNPHILALYLRYARELYAAGHKRLSIALITERIRWDSLVTTVSERYKIANAHRAYYARLVSKIDNTLVFRTIESKADQA